MELLTEINTPSQLGLQNKSEEKTIRSSTPSAFSLLPNEIIEQILRLTDSNSFASLVLLNSKWRRISQQADLYAYHLSHCPSYSASHGTKPAASISNDDLPRLRRLFAREVKRNLFEAYLRPKTTTIKLVSNSISSSSVPGGEGMQFSSSPRGHHLLAYNSSRIYVLNLQGPELDVKRELKILRRPVSTCILDDGTLLAVLSSDMQVDLYDLQEHPPKRTQSLILDHTPRTIALSPCGSVLAAAYEGGIEVSSLAPGALPTDRRAVKCDGVDTLAFSFDGTQLLGTTTIAQPPNTVILTAPYYDPGAQMGDESISALWTTSILFPNTSRDCSHAVLLQESSSEEAAWTFTYDMSFETFRAVRIDDLRNGTTYFTGPIPHAASQTTLLPCTLPAATYCGELVSAGFEGKDIWLYGIPEDLEAIPETTAIATDSSTPALNRHNSAPSVRSASRMHESTGARVPQWQILCDKFRNTFVGGRKVAELTGVSTVKWVGNYGDSSLQERLIVAARGIQPMKPITEEDGIDFVDGGRVTILDFDYGIASGQTTDITIEVGTREPEVLEEEHRDMATEVAIVRRRTVAQRGGGRSGMMRTTTSAGFQAEPFLRQPVPPVPSAEDSDDPLIPRRMIGPRTESRVSSQPEPEPEDVSLEEAQEALDAPYAHANPRSGTTLRRAATAVAVNRRLHPSAATAGRVEYRRADGRAEHPHESDADNWVPPPPPYAKEDPGDLPAFLRQAAIPAPSSVPNSERTRPLAPSQTQPAPSAHLTPATHVPPAPPARIAPSAPPAVTRAPPGTFSVPTRPELPRIHTSPARERHTHSSYQQRNPHSRIASDSTNMSSTRPEGSKRPTSSPITQLQGRPSSEINEDIYDVSPTGSPRQAARMLYQQRSDTATDRRVHTSPHAPSAGTLSSATEYTPASSTYQSATTGSSRNSANPYALNLTIPSPTLNDATLNESQAVASPVVGRLPNPQTWPRVSHHLEPAPAAALAGYPRSAPPTNANRADIIDAALPPPPRADQLASLNNRRDQSAPRRASGIFQLPRVPVGRNSQDRSSVRNSLGSEILPTVSEPEQPLIISTPKGVAGAFDLPGTHAQSAPAGPVLHAPVARHPRPTPGSGSLRPTVERLETIYSIASIGGRDGEVDSNNHHGIRGYVDRQGNPIIAPPPPPSQLTASSLRHHTSLTRRQSRARRSAAKNLQDAKGRGWTGRRNKKKKKKKKDKDGASSVAWTDVTWISSGVRDRTNKERKCAVM